MASSAAGLRRSPRAGLARPGRRRGRRLRGARGRGRSAAGPRPASRSPCARSYAQGHPPEGARDGYRVIRKHGRFMVFPTTVLSEMLRRTGPRDGLVEIWNGMPYLSPLWARGPHITLVHHVHKDMWRLVLEEKLAPYGEFIERRVAPPFYRRTPIVTLSESSRQRAHRLPAASSPSRSASCRPGIDARFTPGGPKQPDAAHRRRRSAHGRRSASTSSSASWPTLRERHPDLQLVIVGDGYERLALEDQIADARRRRLGPPRRPRVRRRAARPLPPGRGSSPARRSPRAGA